MMLLRSMHFFFVMLLLLVCSDSTAMDSDKQSGEGRLGILAEHVEKVKKLSAPKKQWLYSDEIFTTHASMVACCPGNYILAEASLGEIIMRNVNTRSKKTIRLSDIESIAIHPKEALVAALYDDCRAVGIWDANTGKEMRSFKIGFSGSRIRLDVQFYPNDDHIAVITLFADPVVQRVYNFRTGKEQSFFIFAFKPKPIAAQSGLHLKDRDVHVIKEYKDYTLDQLQLKYALSHWLLIEKPDKKIDALEKLLSDVAWKCGLDAQQCLVTWKSFPKPMQWAWLKDILEAIQRHGKR